MRPLPLALAVLLTACAAPAPLAAAASGAIAAKAAGHAAGHAAGGTIRRLADVPSAALGRSRDVWVYLPPGYEAGTTRYPVLYMHDGNNLFDPALAFGGQAWRVDESLDAGIVSKAIRPMIVVGVGNTSERLAEYTWIAGAVGGGPAGGRGADYARFLVSELKPMIDSRYRTRPGRADTGVMGSSLGGLMSLYLGRYEGDVFSKLGVMSPSVWWADRAVLKEPARMRRDLKVWLDCGHREGDAPAEALAEARLLRDGLVKRGVDLRWYEDEQGGHDEQAWAYRFPLAASWLF